MPDSPVEVPLPTPSMEALSSETHALGEILREQHILPRRNAEEGFRESEERYRIVVENSSDGIVILTAAQTFLYANPKCLQIFGYAHKEEILGASVALVVHPEDRDLVLEISRRRQRGEHAPSRYEFRGLRKDGSVVYVEATATKTAYRSEAASLVFLRDITERRHAEEELRRLSLIVERAPEMILILDNTGLVQYANAAFLQTSGGRSRRIDGEARPLLRTRRGEQSFLRSALGEAAAGEKVDGQNDPQRTGRGFSGIRRQCVSHAHYDR